MHHAIGGILVGAIGGAVAYWWLYLRNGRSHRQ
jgi:hypothetical protein